MQSASIILKNNQQQNLSMREDLMCFSRLLCLIAHYELGKDFYIENQIKTPISF